MEGAELDNNNENSCILLLRAKTRTMLSDLLNPHKLFMTDQGIPGDWQGLAELCGIPGELIRNISFDQDPTAKVLKLWYDRSKTDATIDKLMNFLDQMDRTDVIDEVSPLIAEDLSYYKEQSAISRTLPPADPEADKNVLTRDDVFRINEGLEPQDYDAFVLFVDDDIDFATELIENMEKNYNLKFCVKERDLVVGGSEHDAVIKLISERCRRLLVIVSQAFLESNSCKFFYSLAQSISIEQRNRIIIPCIYKDCGTIPPELSCYFKLDFRRTFWNSWDRLHDSIIMPKYKHKMKSLPENRSVSNPNQLLPPNDLKSVLHKNSDSSAQNISHSVRFISSMSNLPDTEVPLGSMTPSTSANNLGTYQETGVKKSPSFYDRFKSSILSKLKSAKQPSDQAANKTQEKQNGKIPSDTKVDNNEIKDTNTEQNETKGDIIDKKEEKSEKKKKKFTLKRNKKKKALVADT